MAVNERDMESSRCVREVLMSNDQSKYRVYSLDGAGKFLSAEWVDADSDESAIAAVRSSKPGSICELWEGRRMVTTLSPIRLSA